MLPINITIQMCYASKNNTGMVFSLAERWKIIMTKMEAVEENIIKSTKEKDNVEKGVN
jgi:hypothetical protein